MLTVKDLKNQYVKKRTKSLFGFDLTMSLVLPAENGSSMMLLTGL